MRLNENIRSELLSFAYRGTMVCPHNMGRYVLITCCRGERPTRRLSIDETVSFIEQMKSRQANGRA